MGGLIGLSLMLEHPDIFGSSIGLSTHWTGINFADYLLLPIRGYIGPSDSTAQALIAYFEQFKSQMCPDAAAAEWHEVVHVHVSTIGYLAREVRIALINHLL